MGFRVLMTTQHRHRQIERGERQEEEEKEEKKEPVRGATAEAVASHLKCSGCWLLLRLRLLIVALLLLCTHLIID